MPAYNFCYLADEPQDVQALGRGYPPDQEIYLYVYEHNDAFKLSSLPRRRMRTGIFLPVWQAPIMPTDSILFLV